VKTQSEPHREGSTARVEECGVRRVEGAPGGHEAESLRAAELNPVFASRRLARQRISEDIMITEIIRPLSGHLNGADILQPPPPKPISVGGYLKFRNDRGIPEIRIGVREFRCIGVSPPQDHPHVYLNMGETGTILCPYCGTRFRFDPQLMPLEVDPPDSFFADSNAASIELTNKG